MPAVEREVGSGLFIRTASSVEPTDSGPVFVAVGSAFDGDTDVEIDSLNVPNM